MRPGAGPVARRLAAPLLAALVAAAAAHTQEAHAQEMNGQGGEEIRLLREATARETAGDLAGAERILRSILAARPNSLSAILSLERLLRVQGRLEELLPAIDALLAVDPTSAIGHQMRVRTYSALDRVEDLERAGEDWVRAMPRVETPYREVARVWEARGDADRAIEVLERGRARLGRPDALALELGELYARRGEIARAAREWDRAIGPDGRGLSLVRRRVAELPDGGARVLPPLIDALARRPEHPERLRAAAELAIDAGLAARAEEIGRRAAARLAGPARQAFLVEVARRAEGAGLARLAFWAYAELLAQLDAEEAAAPRRAAAGALPDQRLAVRSRLAELALTLGDTAAAREHYRAVEEGLAPGSPERRRATAFRLELVARTAELDEAVRALESFHREFPDAPELDRLAGTLAARLLDRGDIARAERILAGVSGPRSSLARGRIALRRSDIAAARAAFLAAAPALQGEEATETLELATLLGRISPEGGELLGRGLSEAAQGRMHEAVATLSGGARGLGPDERPAILEFAAALADRGHLPEEAERIRRTIIADHPRAPEAPAALLALARTVAERDPHSPEARELLERLILEHPRSALVPQARRELERLQGRIPKS